MGRTLGRRGTGLMLALITAAILVTFVLATQNDGFGTGSHNGVDIATSELAMILMSLGAVLSLQFFLSLTRMGRWLRAAASNPSWQRYAAYRCGSSRVWCGSSARHWRPWPE